MAKKDVVLNIIAKTDKFEKQMLETGRYTERQAKAIARKWEREHVNAFLKTEKAAKRSAKNVGTAWSTAIGMLSAGAIKGAVLGLADLAQESVDLQNELNDTAVRTGLAAETLAGLRLAAKRSGQELNALTPSLAQFPKRMSDFAQGTGEAKDALQALGFEAGDVVGPGGTLKEADVVFREIVDRLRAVDSTTTQAALATDIFGESGTRLLQAFASGQGDMDAYIDAARTFGAVDGPAAAKAAADWQKSTAEMNLLWEKFTSGLANAATGTGALDAAILSLVGTSAAATALINEMGKAFTGRSNPITGWVEAYKAADRATKAWVEQRGALEGGDGLTKNVGDLGDSLEGYVANAKAAADAAKKEREEQAASAKEKAEQAKARNAWQREVAAVHSSALAQMGHSIEMLNDANSESESTAVGRWTKEIDKVQAMIEKLQQLEGERGRIAMLEQVRGQLAAERSKQRQAEIEAETEAERQAAQERVNIRARAMDSVRETEEQTIIDLDDKRVKSAFLALDTASVVADGVAAIAGAAQAKSAAARKRVAIAQRAAAVFSIGINTAAAIMQALGTLPPPAGFVAAAAAGVAGAVQAGIVLSKPLPAFHSGGVVQADLLEGEGVLNQRAVQDLGRNAVEQMNNGTAGQSGPVQAVLAFNDRIMDRLVGRVLRADGVSGRMARRPALAAVSPYR